jgi:hypothetical protein
VADLTLDKHILQEVLSMRARSATAGEVDDRIVCVSERRACGLIEIRGRVFDTRVGPDQAALRLRLKELAAVRIRLGIDG